MKSILPIDRGHLPFLKPLVFYTVGIIVGSQVCWSLSYLICTTALSVAVASGLCCLAYRGRIRQVSIGLFLFFFLLGMTNYGFFAPQSRSGPQDALASSEWVGRVLDVPIERARTIRFPVRLIAGYDTAWRRASGEVMVTVSIDTSQRQSLPSQGDVLHCAAKLQVLPPAYNPRQFDYKRYLEYKGITFQSYVDAQAIRWVSKGSYAVNFMPHVRSYLVQKFHQYIDDDLSFQIATALVFGYRSEIDQSTLSAFTNTGTIHVLSVSGLHVTLVFGFLSFFLKFLDRWRYGRSIRYCIILVLIWCYVVLTGMAPPILRSGIMISFLILGEWVHRKQQTINTLLASAFFILILFPEMLFDVGFQLSYAAMFGIFLLYPLLRHCYLPKYRWGGIFVEYCYVSVAAQVFTAPFAFYYFGQFPNYFLLANLVVSLPATLIMYAGLVLMVLPYGLIGVVLGTVITYLVQGMYYCLHAIELWPYAAVKGWYMSGFLVSLGYVFLLALFLAVNYREKRMLYIAAVCSMMLFLLIFARSYESSHFDAVIIYNVRKEVAIAQIKRGRAVLYTTLDSINHPTLSYSVLPSLLEYVPADVVQYAHLKDSTDYLLRLSDKTIHIKHVDGQDISDVDMVVHRHHLFDEIAFSGTAIQVIDGSNTNYSVQKTKKVKRIVAMEYYILKDNFAYVWDK